MRKPNERMSAAELAALVEQIKACQAEEPSTSHSEPVAPTAASLCDYLNRQNLSADAENLAAENARLQYDIARSREDLEQLLNRCKALARRLALRNDRS